MHGARAEGPARALQVCGKALMAAVAAGFLAACMDGYPQHETPIISPYDMTQAQRLAEMNALGAQAHAQWSWTYELLPGCVLRIDLDGPDGPMPSRDIALLGAVVAVTASRSEGSYRVEVEPAQGREADRAQVMESGKWADASWAQLLLRLMQKGCIDMLG